MGRSRAFVRCVVLVLVASGLVTIAAPQASAATLVVPTAFPTIQDAVDSASAGDVIKVKPGVYDENVVITTDDITIRGTDRAKVVIDGFDAGPALDQAAFIATATSVQFDNMTVRNGEASGIRCTGDGCAVTNVTVPRSVSGDCITIDGNDGLVQNTRLRACSSNAIDLTGDDARILGNDMRLIDSDCVDLEGDDALVKGNVVRNCEDGDGISMIGAGHDVVRNEVFDVANECYFVDGIGPRIHKNRAGNCDSPFEIRGENMVVTSNVSSRSGDDDGFDIDCVDLTGGAPLATACDEGRVAGNSARGTNDDDEGFEIDVEDASGSFEVIGNTARENNDEGFDIDMDNGVIKNNVATANGSEDHEGIGIFGNNNTITGNVSNSNGGGGFTLEGDGNSFSGNVAKFNAIDGIHVRGDGNTISGNTAKGQHADGIENGDSATNTDFINNVSSGNQIDCANDGDTDVVTGNSCADGSHFIVGSTGMDGS